jgi:hypothetical protein
MLTHWDTAEALVTERRRDLELDAARRRLARRARSRGHGRGRSARRGDGGSPAG